jgi:hypothetical protein
LLRARSIRSWKLSFSSGVLHADDGLVEDAHQVVEGHARVGVRLGQAAVLAGRPIAEEVRSLLLLLHHHQRRRLGLGLDHVLDQRRHSLDQGVLDAGHAGVLTLASCGVGQQAQLLQRLLPPELHLDQREELLQRGRGLGLLRARVTAGGSAR